ncbi:MAG TPA: SufD family Fe-S cluster assembly protein, partial [Hyphomicrobiaceae bacterium]|nr:SufD family Fe-S cluster assembly protein [Hyphomicrobiaceae bacterium]
FDSKPELEIYADDVACGHGATVSEIDPDLVFYCRSRGIPADQARALIIQSFIAEAIDKVEHPAIGEALQALATEWLAKHAAAGLKAHGGTTS